MTVYCAFKFKPLGAEELVGIGSSKEAAVKILKEEFPYMRSYDEGETYISDAKATYLLAIRQVCMDEVIK